MTLAVDYAHAAQAVSETLVEKIAQYRACLGHGASVQIAFGLYGQLPAAQALHCAVLQAAAGEQQLFAGFVVAGVKAVGEQVAQNVLLVALAEAGARGWPRQAVLDAVVGHGPDRADAGFEQEIVRTLRVGLGCWWMAALVHAGSMPHCDSMISRYVRTAGLPV